MREKKQLHMQSHMKSVVASLLAAVMILSLSYGLVSCGNGDKRHEQKEEGKQTETTTEQPVVTEAPDIDFDKKFNDEVTVMYWNDVEKPEFFVEDQNGDRVNDAIYFRNIDVENRLGIKLKFVGTPGNYGHRAEFVAEAEKSVKSGGDYDIFAGYSHTAASLTVGGLVQSMNNLKYINFDKPWWPDNIVDKVSIRNKIFFCSGDISTNLLHMMYVTFFNKQVLNDHPEMENPYELVESNKWQLDKFLEMAEAVSGDLNGNGIKDEGDAFGLATYAIHYDAFYISAGLKSIERNNSGDLVVSKSFSSETTHKLVVDLAHFVHDTDCCHSKAKSSGAVFSKGNTLFTVDRSYMPLWNQGKINFEYGIVPVPKLEENAEFVTCVGFPYTMYSISIASKRPDTAAATLECLGMEGYRRVTPELFEVTMKYRYSFDNEVTRMYDIVRNKADIDLGRVFSQPLNEISWKPFREAVEKNQAGNWASAVRAYKKVMENSLKKINEAIEKILENSRG